MSVSPSPSRRWLERMARLGALLALLATSAVVTAQTDTAPAGGTGTPAPADSTTAPAEPAPTQCIHGCQRWGKMCNIDPRGVYKCYRRCEKFGEICE